MTYQGPVIKNYQDANVTLLPESIALSAMMGRIEHEQNKWKKLIYYYYKILRKVCYQLGYDYELYLFEKIAKHIDENNQFDYVASCQEGGATYFATFFKRAKKFAWFRNEYSIYKDEYPQAILDKDQVLYPKLDKIICVSKTTRDDFATYFPRLKQKVISIHNIQNVDNIRAKAQESITDFPSAEFVIVSVGRMNPQKRFSVIPSISRLLLDKGCSFKWIILGDGNAFGEWDRLQVEISKQGVESTVLCLGSKLNPYPYIQKADLLVNTSYVEACPRVVIEAKLLKTPVVCADFSSAREFVSNDYDGYVDTIENIVNHIEKMIKDHSLYSRIKQVCDNYEIDNERIYSQLRELFS